MPKRKMSYYQRQAAARVSSLSLGHASKNSPIASSLRTSLRYASSGSMTAFTAVDGGRLLININSLYAPGHTAGHQPMGFDQLAALYDYYRVEQVRVQVVMQAVNTAEDSFFFGMFAEDGANDPVVASVCQERTNNTGIVGSVGRDGANGNHCQPISMVIDLAKLRGQTRSEYRGDDLNRSLTTSGPSNGLYIVPYTVHGGAGVLGFVGHVSYQLEYDVTFWDPKQMVTSTI